MIIKNIENAVFNGINLKFKDTKIDLTKTSAIFECVDNIEIPFIHDEVHCDYLFCTNDKGEKITLYDCCIALNQTLQRYIKSVLIVYNKILIGDFLDNIITKEIDNFEAVIDRKEWPYIISIINNDWEIKDFHIHTGRDVVEGRATSKLNIKINPISRKHTFDDSLNVFHNIISILFWGVGYFPDMIRIKVLLDNKVLEYISPNQSIFETSDNIKGYEILYPKFNNFSDVYDNWEKLYKSNIVLFHIFWGIQNSHSPEESKTFNYIQCLEAFFTNNILKDKYDPKYRESIKNIFADYLKKSKKNKLVKKMKRIIGRINSNGQNYSLDEFSNSLQGKLSDINELSLYQKIKTIYSNKYSLSIFKYEYDNNLIKTFIIKTYNHRNFMAHINNSDSYFKKHENTLIHSKFKLLFRMLIMDYIGLEYDLDSFNKCIDIINKWYKKYSIEKRK